MSKVLITGGKGFTGSYLYSSFTDNGFYVLASKTNILDKDKIREELISYKPDYIIHLAAVSFTAHSDHIDIYNVNVLGTLNLLESIISTGVPLKKLILASSASVYGDLNAEILSESMCPNPINHYGCSKFVMEQIAKNFINLIPIIIVRPFNYTGRNQSERFIIPKLVQAFKQGAKNIALGNIDIFREFNDVRDISKIYLQLLLSSYQGTVNISSGRTYCIRDIISRLEHLFDRSISISINQDFVRKDELYKLGGDSSLLKLVINTNFEFDINDTLEWMVSKNYD